MPNKKAIFETVKGTIEAELFTDEVPNTVANFAKLANAGFYDGTRFHRVIPNFMIQGGDPYSKGGGGRVGTGGPGYTIKCETEKNVHKHAAGTLSMAHAGKDTIAGERYPRGRDELRDDMVLRDRSPVTTRRLVAMLRPDGSVARLEFDTRAAGGAKDPPAMHGVATFTTEETFFEVTRGGETRRATVVTPGGAMPFLNFCYGLYEQIGRRAHALGGASVEVPAIWFGASLPFTLTVTFPSPDSMTVGFGDQAPTLMNVDAAGRILRADGRLTTQ